MHSNISPIPPLIATWSQKVGNLASVFDEVAFEEPSFENGMLVWFYDSLAAVSEKVYLWISPFTHQHQHLLWQRKHPLC